MTDILAYYYNYFINVFIIIIIIIVIIILIIIINILCYAPSVFTCIVGGAIQMTVYIYIYVHLPCDRRIKITNTELEPSTNIHIPSH